MEGKSGGFGAAALAAAVEVGGGSNQTAALSPGSASHLKADRLLSWSEGGGRARRHVGINNSRQDSPSGGRNSEREVETGPGEQHFSEVEKKTFLQTADNDDTISPVLTIKLRRWPLTVCRCRSCGRRSS